MQSDSHRDQMLSEFCANEKETEKLDSTLNIETTK